eukprot:165484-Chlamydomonas_euryale.AAC.1
MRGCREGRGGRSSTTCTGAERGGGDAPPQHAGAVWSTERCSHAPAHTPWNGECARRTVSEVGWVDGVDGVARNVWWWGG